MSDIEFCRNNGVWAIRPTEGGRWNDLIIRTAAGEQRVWVFSDAKPYKDAAGNECMDFLTRGVMHGPYRAGFDFIERCRKARLVAEEADFYVPFSNGKRVHAQTDEGASIWVYTEDEYHRRRFDDPPDGELFLAYCAM